MAAGDAPVGAPTERSGGTDAHRRDVGGAGRFAFGRLVECYDALVQAHGRLHRRRILEALFEQYEATETHPGSARTHSDYFALLRLLLPRLDKERSVYGLKETALAKALVKALHLGESSEEAKRLFEWRTNAGEATGNLAQAAKKVLHRRCTSRGRSIKDVNDYLDRLMRTAGQRGDGEKGKAYGATSMQAAVLSEMTNNLGEEEMFWVIKHVLKDDFKLGCGETAVFNVFHTDAKEHMNTTSSLRDVAETCGRNRNKRVRRRDVEVGKCVRAMLASATRSVERAANVMRGKNIVVECKFDGERSQVHFDRSKGGAPAVHMYSRKMNDHADVYKVLTPILERAFAPGVQRAILDCEVVAYSPEAAAEGKGGFVPFGTVRGIAKALGDGGKDAVREPRDAEMCLIVFDIIYVNDTSLLHYTLEDRHSVLKKHLRPTRDAGIGAIDLVVPDLVPILPGRVDHYSDRASSGGKEAESLIRSVFERSIDRAEEGILIKDLASRWEPADRGDAWLKMKPDYVKGRVDLDCLIIGAFYGTNRRGGGIAEFLVGLGKEPVVPGAQPTQWESFAKIGGGFSDQDRNTIRDKLKDHLIKYEPNKNPPEYIVTHHVMERPHFWVAPGCGIVLQVAADVRLIHSDVFASKYSLRFPRCERVRYDKSANESLTDKGLDRIIAENTKAGGGGMMLMTSGHLEGVGSPGKTKTKQRKAPQPQREIMEARYRMPDGRRVQMLSEALQGMHVHIVQGAEGDALWQLQIKVIRNGGELLMNLPKAKMPTVPKRTLGRGMKRSEAPTPVGDMPAYDDDIVVVAPTPKSAALDILRRADNVDVLSPDWLDECDEHQVRAPIQACHYVFMCSATRRRLSAEIDEYGDSYTEEVTAKRVRTLINTVSCGPQGGVDGWPRRGASAREALIDEYEEIRTPLNALAGACILLLPTAPAGSPAARRQESDLRALACEARYAGAEVLPGGVGQPSGRLQAGGSGGSSQVYPTHVVLYYDPMFDIVECTQLDGAVRKPVDIAVRHGALVVKHTWLEASLRGNEFVDESGHRMTDARSS